MQFVAFRDHCDHIRFSPLQTAFSQELCESLNLEAKDLSSAYFIAFVDSGDDKELQVHQFSSSILYMFAHMGFPFDFFLPFLLWIPLFIRDTGYRMFARNRGTIWKAVKRCSGLGDTHMATVRDKLVGLGDDDANVECFPESWGLSRNNDGGGGAGKEKDE